MKINRVSNEQPASNPAERSAHRSTLPWSWILRSGTENSRALELPPSLEDVWPGARDVRWSARLLASLYNTGHTRLRFRA
jgi:hypothetical protein